MVPLKLGGTMLSLDIGVEMEGLNLNDRRLNTRCLKLIESFQNQPEAAIPAACSTAKEIKAAYRFFQNPKITPEKLLQPHTLSTIKRCQKESLVLLIEDTTEIDFTDKSVLQKLGRLDHVDRQGMYAHPTLAVSLEGNILGICSNIFFDREKKPIHPTRKYKKTKIEEKESYRWLQGIKKAHDFSIKLPETDVVYVADSESDIYDCLQEGVKTETECYILIRSTKERNTTCKIKGSKKKYRKASEALMELPARGTISFKTQSGHGKKGRNVTQTMRFGGVQLRANRNEIEKYPDIEINAIVLTEDNPPIGCKAINWTLWTTYPIAREEDVLKVIRMYCLRWKIEVFFHLLKTYCQVEELKLINKKRLEACITLYMIVAWRLLGIQMLIRSQPTSLCTIAFTELEWKVAYMWFLKKTKQEMSQLPKTPVSLQEFIPVFAALGGHLNRKQDGPIGPKKICIAYARLQGLVEGWELCQKFTPTYG